MTKQIKIKKRRESVKTLSLYEAAFLLASGCRIEELKVIKELGQETCLIILSGESIKTLQLQFLNSEASVDPLLYQKAISKVRTLVYAKVGRIKQPIVTAGQQEAVR